MCGSSTAYLLPPFAGQSHDQVRLLSDRAALITVIFFPVAREHPAPFPKVELVKALE